MKTIENEWPKYSIHELVFSCGKWLTGERNIDAGYPKGQGRYRVDCPDCGMGTHYDIESELEAK